MSRCGQSSNVKLIEDGLELETNPPSEAWRDPETAIRDPQAMAADVGRTKSVRVYLVG
jgi:hypothetical protein